MNSNSRPVAVVAWVIFSLALASCGSPLPDRPPGDRPPSESPVMSCQSSVARTRLKSCLAERSEGDFDQIQRRFGLWAAASGDPSGRAGMFPSELLALSGFRRQFELQDHELQCLLDRICERQERSAEGEEELVHD